METKEKLMRVGVFFLVVLTILTVVKIFSAVREYRFIGLDNSKTAVISVEGEAHKMIVPDLAGISFGVIAEAKDAKTAQDEAAKKNNAVVTFLKQNGVAEKDILSRLALNPKYAPETNTQVGFIASYNLEVKIRDLTKVGDLIAGVTKLGVNNFYGPNFSVEDEKAAVSSLRTQAIADAKAKAEILAADLGVELVRIVEFNEGGGPVFFAKTMMAEAADAGTSGDVAPEVLPGERKVTSNVVITYEVR